VLGTNEKFDIFKLTDSFEKKNLACVYVDDLQKRNSVINSAHSADGDDRTRAFLKIQDGCDYTCSFCTIPFARGGSRSIPIPEIKMSFQHLLSSGYKEIILTGVNVGDYGKNISSSLYQLLSALISVEDDFRIRVSSIEPNLISDELIDLFAGSGKLCNHFHIPLQSGSDKVLKLMQRRYNAAHYAERVARIKSVIPDAGIGVDVIVGFPEEDSKDFEETRLFLEHLPVSYLHVFTYSERPDTKAILMGNQVDKQVRKIRNRILRELSEKKRNDFTASFIGKNVKVLFEHQDSDGKMRGFSDNYLRCEAAFNADYVNQFSVRTIKRAEKEICYI
jgi:threonylcarbamoyladenosine tRNA methylthiotransferase MtaB